VERGGGRKRKTIVLTNGNLAALTVIVGRTCSFTFGQRGLRCQPQSALAGPALSGLEASNARHHRVELVERRAVIGTGGPALHHYLLDGLQIAEQTASHSQLQHQLRALKMSAASMITALA